MRSSEQPTKIRRKLDEYRQALRTGSQSRIQVSEPPELYSGPLSITQSQPQNPLQRIHRHRQLRHEVKADYPQ